MTRHLTSDADQLAAMKLHLARFRDDPAVGHAPNTPGWLWLNRIIDGYPDPVNDQPRFDDYERWLCEDQMRAGHVRG